MTFIMAGAASGKGIAEHETLSKNRLLHAADAYNQIASADREAIPSIKGSYQKDTFFVSLPNSFSTGECTQHGEHLGVCERTIYRWMDSWLETGQIIKTNHGNYQKVG